MTKIALVSWHPASNLEEWEHFVAKFEMELNKLPNCSVRHIRWPGQGIVSLTPFQFLIFAYPVQHWFPRQLDEGWGELLSKAGNLIGKSAHAVTGLQRLGSEKTLVLLMNSLESEGMVVRNFEFLRKGDSIYSFVEKLKQLEKMIV